MKISFRAKIGKIGLFIHRCHIPKRMGISQCRWTLNSFDDLANFGNLATKLVGMSTSLELSQKE